MIFIHINQILRFKMAQFPFKYKASGHLQFETASGAINYLQNLKGFSLSIVVLPVFDCEQQLY